MKMFLLGFITVIVAYLLYVFLRSIALFMWGDWQTGEIWKPIIESWRRRKELRKR